MGKEVLAIPEENLREVILVIQIGLKHVDVSADTKSNLIAWCEGETEYLDSCGGFPNLTTPPHKRER